ncbi:MAG: PQQ-binding-like beta-propeller repeat protein [Myxococcota bacterium]
MRSARLLAHAVCGVALLVLCRPAGAWEFFVDNIPNSNGEGRDVVVDAAGDVLAVGRIIDLTVAKLDGVNGQEIWRRTVPGTLGVAGRPNAIAAAPNGDALVVGSVTNLPTFEDFLVARLDGSNGAEIWRRDLDGTAGSGDKAFDVALDGSGDVVTAGRLDNTGTAWDFAVVKFSGATGTELWRYERDGGALQSEEAKKVVIDPSGDVIAGGFLRSLGAGADLAVVKLSGASGTELWRTQVGGTAGLNDEVLDLKVDAQGDVYLTGFANNTGTQRDLVVCKLAGADGSTLWRLDLDGGASDEDRGTALAVNGGGRLFVGGRLVAFGTGPDLAVIGLNTSTGSVLWTYRLNGSANDFDELKDLTLGPDGEPVAVGFVTGTKTIRDWAVVRLDQATGAERWRHEVNGVANLDDEGTAIAKGPGGEIFVAGRLWREVPSGPIVKKDPSREFTVMRFEGATGADVRLISGKRIAFRDKQASLRNQKLSVVSNDSVGIVAPIVGSRSDPTIGGGRLVLRRPPGTLAPDDPGETDEFLLPAQNWKTIGPKRRPTGYRYSDPDLSEGPCRSIRLRTTRLLRASCTGAQILYTLNEPQQQTLSAMLELGSTPVAYCVEFEGTILKDVPVTGFFRRGSFRARVSPIAPACAANGPP